MYAHYNTRARTPRTRPDASHERVRAMRFTAPGELMRLTVCVSERVRVSQNKRGNFFRNRLPLKRLMDWKAQRANMNSHFTLSFCKMTGLTVVCKITNLNQHRHLACPDIITSHPGETRRRRRGNPHVRGGVENVPFIATEDFCFTVTLVANLLVIAGFRADGGLFSVKRMCCVNESMLNTKRQYSSPRTGECTYGYRTARTVLSPCGIEVQV